MINTLSDPLPIDSIERTSQTETISLQPDLEKIADDLIEETHTSRSDNINNLQLGNEQEKIRFVLFSELLNKFTKNVTETHLNIMRKRHPQVYRDDCTQLYAFNLDVETIENHNWIKLHFPTYRKNFPTRNFSQTFKTKWLVTNVIRHCMKWLNDNYQFQRPLVYQNIEMTWLRTNGESKLTNVNFIAF